MGARGGALLLAAAALFAGCLAPATELTAPLAAEATEAADEAAALLTGKKCLQAGGHSTYDKSEFVQFGILPEPWVPADVTGDVGKQLLSSSFDRPHLDDEIVGNYHVSVTCDAYVVDGEERAGLAFGWVAIKVEAPPFDTGGADHHYLITMLSFPDEGLVELFRAAGIHATKAIAIGNDWTSPAVVINNQGPSRILHSYFDDEGHGIYETTGPYEGVGEREASVTRLWLLVDTSGGDEHHALAGDAPGHGGPYKPVAIDMVDGPADHIISRSGWFSHMRTSDHAFVDEPTTLPPGAVGRIPGFGLLVEERALVAGPQPEGVLLSGKYDHV